jgi:hypothetical protein
MSESVSNSTGTIEEKPILTTKDEKMPVIAEVQSLIPLKGKERRKPSRTFMVKYGPILIRKRDSLAPTLATGRRPKDAIVQGEDLAKLEIRRMKNRLSARNLKKMRDNIEHDLENQVKNLENEEQNLLTKIDVLEAHREQLQQIYQQTDRIYEKMTQTAADIVAEFKRKKALRHVVQIEPKEELRSPSPQWQLSFLI